MGNPRIRLGLLFRRWWPAVLLATVGGALVAYAFGSRVSTTYEANVQILVGHPEGLAPTYAELAKSTPVLAYALRHAKQDVSLAELRRNVRGESDQSTRIVTIEADAAKGSEAIALANAVAAGLRDYVLTQPSIGAAGALQSSEPRVEIVDPATSATRIRPRPALLLEFGAFAGLLAGLAFALLAEARTPRINAEEDLAAAGGPTVLGTLNAGGAQGGSRRHRPSAPDSWPRTGAWSRDWRSRPTRPSREPLSSWAQTEGTGARRSRSISVTRWPSTDTAPRSPTSKAASSRVTCRWMDVSGAHRSSGGLTRSSRRESRSIASRCARGPGQRSFSRVHALET